MSSTNDDNVTPLPQAQPKPNWTRKINIPLPVLPLHIRQRLRTPGYWTAMLAITAFGSAYASGQFARTRDILVALSLTGFVVILGAVGMICQAIKDSRAAVADRTYSEAESSRTTAA